MNTLEIVKARLLAAGVSTVNTGAWPCFIGTLPDLQDQVLGMQYTGGFPQDTHLGENAHQTFQVFVRAVAYNTCEAKWHAMHAALNNGESDTTMAAAGIHLMQCYTGGPIFFLDSKGRSVMTANFRVVRSA